MGNCRTRDQLVSFRNLILGNAAIHQSMFHSFAGFPTSSHPMAILSAMLNSLGCYYPHMATNNREQDLEHLDVAATILISKVRSLAAMAYRMKLGRPFIYPKGQLSYCSNLLHMMFSEPYADYTASSRVDRALNLFLLLHADHEQNCSTSTVRMVASGGANLFASVSAGVCALWGPAHGGANMAVIEMLEAIHKEGDDGTRFVEAAKSGDRSKRLMGFGHRVYKNYDPRAKILKEVSKKLFASMRIKDPVLDIALKLEEIATHDEYFIERKLYPNVDFYSGIIMRSIGIPVDFFTVLFAIGRMPGWIANWKEIAMGKSPIHRPRQIYTGSGFAQVRPAGGAGLNNRIAFFKWPSTNHLITPHPSRSSTFSNSKFSFSSTPMANERAKRTLRRQVHSARARTSFSRLREMHSSGGSGPRCKP